MSEPYYLISCYQLGLRPTSTRTKLPSYEIAMREVKKKAVVFMTAGVRGRIEDLPFARRPFLIKSDNSYTVVTYDINGRQYEAAVFTIMEYPAL